MSLSSKLDKIGDSIVAWSDPDTLYQGATDGWPWTEFSSAVYVAVAYVLFVVIGSQVMSSPSVKPVDPYMLKFVYNMSQMMLCAYMTIEAVLVARRAGYGLEFCNPYDAAVAPVGNLLWIFYVSKIWDFWDTIFIVLGKKWKQLSFLHVYHHTTIFLFYWLNSRMNFDGPIYLTVALNGFIHTVMYTYYFVCMHTKDPNTGKSIPIWWKSSLTMLQMIQFVTMMSQAFSIYFTDCRGSSPRIVLIYFFYIATLLFLFAQFYVASYMKPKKKKKA
mmetsp:Transcript_14056/g.28037  ORF Transcript_14056/g.28037 Transcript_14056/m.28037 type:complete len:274 (+) Transcript_14056:179-1000(+)|eukprot:CAMPEP_0194323364 /NCGR_PEP_ID=MMETSP0171-20130528/25455_1 /TAXON_ID=218684 /ORGANISM="Corethron pennatum, Strain L29A3" /LENGTH=273 /DNA_ID=CAMNT_0039081997 /DNA_START=179 /DNA_END=1000 /DNA_ORIENTATION=+